MIISASRRTDIPAFYSDWFINRARAGFFYRANPFNRRQVAGFSLRPEHVDAICFWTKNPQPLLPHLAELDRLGLNYYFQFTLNPYGKAFEPRVPPLAERITAFNTLAERIGPQRVIWRYDPVILSSATPVTWHLAQAKRLAEQLAPATRRMVFSLCDVYGRGRGRLHDALQGSGILLDDAAAPRYAGDLAALARGFKEIAERFRLRLFSCCEEPLLADFGIEPGACIDGTLIRDLFGNGSTLRKDRHQRPACGCAASVDMGSYNSCDFGCGYCYANSNSGMLAENRRRHDPSSPLLLGNHEGAVEIRTSLHTRQKSNCQPGLF